VTWDCVVRLEHKLAPSLRSVVSANILEKEYSTS